NPELLAAFEPTPLPGRDDVAASTADEDSGQGSDPIALPAGDQTRLAAVVTPRFGGDRGDPLTDAWVDEEAEETPETEQLAEEPAGERARGGGGQRVAGGAGGKAEWVDHAPEPQEPVQTWAEAPADDHDVYSVEAPEPLTASYDVPEPVDEEQDQPEPASYE